MNPTELFFNQIDIERNTYQAAELFHQNRKKVKSYIANLQCECGGDLYIADNKAICKNCKKEYPISEEVINFCANKSGNATWDHLNQQFLNYHKSLTAYTLLNSAPLNNYVGIESGMNNLQDVKLVDVGGGTGHMYCSFFNHPETIDYYLVDPNLRMVHDQLLRVYPKLTQLSISHILSSAEKLPFKNEFADVVMSYSAIDHYADFKLFIAEAKRILKNNGTLFISSHLDLSAEPYTSNNKGLHSLLEKAARYFYYKKNGVGADDHTLHLKNTDIIINELNTNGFEIEKNVTFKRYFYIIAKKK